jgi:hypothetical protein
MQAFQSAIKVVGDAVGDVVNPQEHVQQAYAPPPPIWVEGLGMTDRTTADGWVCALCPSRPSKGCCGGGQVVFADPNRTKVGIATHDPAGCCSGTATVEGDVIGVHQKYVHEKGGCCDDATITIMSNGISAGSISHKSYACPCACSARPLMEASNAEGRQRYRLEQPGCCDAREKSNKSMCAAPTEDETCCGILSNDQRIMEEGLVHPATYMSFRSHMCCANCYPTWFGYKQWPMGADNEDKMLLAGMLSGYMRNGPNANMRRVLGRLPEMTGIPAPAGVAVIPFGQMQ